MSRSRIRFDPAPRWPLKRWFARACAAFGVAGIALWWAVPAVEAGAPPAPRREALWAGSTSPFAPLAPAATATEPPGSLAATEVAPTPPTLPAPSAGVPLPAPAPADAGAPAAPPVDAQAADTEAEN